MSEEDEEAGRSSVDGQGAADKRRASYQEGDTVDLLARRVNYGG